MHLGVILKMFKMKAIILVVLILNICMFCCSEEWEDPNEMISSPRVSETGIVVNCIYNYFSLNFIIQFI